MTSLVQLPLTTTLVPRIPLSKPRVMPTEDILAKPFTPKQQAVRILNNIDPSRLSSARSGKAKSNNPYSHNELKLFAKSLGISSSSSKSKAQLVAAIQAAIQ